jgi:hypothetical protein
MYRRWALAAKAFHSFPDYLVKQVIRTTVFLAEVKFFAKF